MADREKIISDLEWIHNALMHFTAIDPDDAVLKAIPEAVELLKEQKHKDKMFHALEEDWKRLKALLKEQEAVVRCKDCKNWTRRECGSYGTCWMRDGFCDADWFCADGEREDSDG